MARRIDDGSLGRANRTIARRISQVLTKRIHTITLRAIHARFTMSARAG